MSTVLPSMHKSASCITSGRLGHNTTSCLLPFPTRISHLATILRVADFSGMYAHHSRTPLLFPRSSQTSQVHSDTAFSRPVRSDHFCIYLHDISQYFHHFLTFWQAPFITSGFSCTLLTSQRCKDWNRKIALTNRVLTQCISTYWDSHMIASQAFGPDKAVL